MITTAILLTTALPLGAIQKPLHSSHVQTLYTNNTTMAAQFQPNCTSTSTIMYYTHQETTHHDDNFDLNHLIMDIEQLSNIEEDWNDCGAPPPNNAAISNAKNFIVNKIIPALHLFKNNTPKIMPLDDGDVAAYWKSNNRYIEIAFSGDDKYYYYADTSETNFISNTDIPIDTMDPSLLGALMSINN